MNFPSRDPMFWNMVFIYAAMALAAAVALAIAGSPSCPPHDAADADAARLKDMILALTLGAAPFGMAFATLEWAIRTALRVRDRRGNP